jgi:RNA polymerase sigma factor (TIGR02999 family)
LSEPSQADITRWLHDWGAGNAAALERLTPLVYNELRRIAHGYMRFEGQENSMQATALVHEAYLKLVDGQTAQWHDRVHFFAICARMMRRILIDNARAKVAEKRGGGAVPFELKESINGMPLRDEQLVRLDDALAALAEFDERKAKVVEMRFFGGLSAAETAEVLKVSEQTVLRDWKLARAWLARELERG